MYLKKITYAGQYMRVEKYHSGRIGCHAPRGEHINKTPKKNEEINQKKAEIKLLDLIRCNFKRGKDAHVVLTYSGVPPNEDTAKKHAAGFVRKLRSEYKKIGEELKYIHVTEYQNSRIHHHFIINNIKNADLIIKSWDQHGIAHIIALYTEDFERLADYLVKETSVRKQPESGYRRRWCCSQNLAKPKVVIHRIHSKKWKPKAPDVIGKYKIVHGTTVNTVDINGRPMQTVLYKKE